MPIFCKQLRYKAAMRGFSLHELSRCAGVSYRTVFSAAHGHGVLPGTARKICAALGCTVADIFEFEEVGQDGAQRHEDIGVY